MQFAAAAEEYDRFMGRFSAPLAVALADYAGVTPGRRVMDVGCGPGALTAELAARLGAENVLAVDPAPQFVAACRTRVPGADVRQGVGEQLPWPDDTVDVALASLVIGFLQDPDRGVRELARVTRPGGTVAACFWDTATGGMTMLATYWTAARTVDPDVAGEGELVGGTDGDLADRFARAGLIDVDRSALGVSSDYADFEEYWTPLTFGVGPAGGHLLRLSPEDRERVREACRAALPEGPFTMTARAWCARGTVPG